MTAKKRCVAVVPAAGASNRMKEYGNKLFLEINRIPVVAKTLCALEKSPEIDAIIIPTRKAAIPHIEELCKRFSITKFISAIPGGDTRTESVLNGVLAAGDDYELIAIHDAARPFVSQRIISETVSAAALYGAAAPAVPMKDTIKKIDGDFIESTVPRETLSAVQTPQIFKTDIIRSALKKAVNEEIPITDDCSAAENIGVRVFLTQGDYFNIKITTPEDLLFASAISSQERKDPFMRIGHGYDVHRLTEGRKLILGGVDIPYEKGLLGHSDADVLLHAISDALLGAAALGDIGKHFPPDDPAFLGADSLKLLERVNELIRDKGYSVNNIDATVIAQKPKLLPYIEEMRQNIANALNTPIDNVSVKATTEEKLGFTGSGEGISAHAVALIE